MHSVASSVFDICIRKYFGLLELVKESKSNSL